MDAAIFNTGDEAQRELPGVELGGQLVPLAAVDAVAIDLMDF